MVSLPAGVPRWAAAHPHLASRLLVWRNAWRSRRERTLLAAALLLAALGVVAIMPPTGPVLGWLGDNWAITFVIAACAFALFTARRRQRASLEETTSWLAPLPTGSSVRIRVLLGTAGWLGALVAFAALLRVVGVVDRFAFARLALAVVTGAIVGLLAGWRLPRAGIGAPGFHYAIVRRSRARWASAPALAPLANWPAAQGRIFSRPKKTAPVVLIVMMSIPAGAHGAPGQVALAAAGGCMALYSLVALSTAAVRVAAAAARWLAPTIVGKWRFTVALNWRVALTQAMMLAVLILLAGAVALPRALAVGVPLAMIYLGTSVALAFIAAFRASRRAGLGASSRGA